MLLAGNKKYIIKPILVSSPSYQSIILRLNQMSHAFFISPMEAYLFSQVSEQNFVHGVARVECDISHKEYSRNGVTPKKVLE